MRIMAIGLLMVSLLGCTTTEHVKDPLKQTVTVTVSGPNMPVTRNTPLSWYSDVISINDTNADAPLNPAVVQWTKAEVQRQMAAKGFMFADEASRYQVVSVLLLGDGDVSHSTQEVFRVFPSLAGEDSKHPKGTLMLGIIDMDTREGVWRSALQVFSNPEATDAELQARLRESVANMLKNLQPS